MVELVNFRKNDDEPITKPNTAAPTTALTMPIAQARIGSQTATQNTASPNLATKSAIAAEAGGINRASTIPTIGNSSQTPRNNTTPAKPNNRLVHVRRRCRTALARPVLVRRPVAPRCAVDTAGAPGSGRVALSKPADRYPAGKSSPAPVASRCKSRACCPRATASSLPGAGPREGSRSVMCSLHYVCKLGLLSAAATLECKLVK